MGEKVQVAAKKPEVKRENLASKSRNADQSQSMSSPVDQVMYLQRTIGNQAVQRLIKSGALQAKLKIGQPGDRYEQEADRVADAVMRMPEPQVQRQPIEEEEEEQIQTKPITEQITPLVQRQVEEEEEEEVQTKPVTEQITPLVQRQVEEEEEELQTKTTSGSIPEVQPNIESHIHSLKGGGQPLSENDRTFFEPRFGRDFSQVRLHTDLQANESTQVVNARAFTVGKDVVFNAGHYAPERKKGRQLLAHELTHVVQQAEGGTSSKDMIRRQQAGGTLQTTASGAQVKAEVAPSIPRQGAERVLFRGVMLVNDKEIMRSELRRLIAQQGLKGADRWFSMLLGREQYTVAPPVPLGHLRGTGALRSRTPIDFMRDERNKAIQRRLTPLTNEVYFNEIRPEAIRFIDDFKDQAKANVRATLTKSKDTAMREAVRYGLTNERILVKQGFHVKTAQELLFYETKHHMQTGTPIVTGLQKAAEVLLARRKNIERLKKEQRSATQLVIDPNSVGMPRGRILVPVQPIYSQLGREVQSESEKYMQIRSVVTAEYPVLAAVSELNESISELEVIAKIGAGDKTAQIIDVRIADTLKNISEVEANLDDESEVNIWRLPPIVDATSAQLGAQADAFKKRIVADKIEHEKPGILGDIALLILNIAAIALAPATGGISLGVAAGVNVVAAGFEIQEYMMKKALAGTDFDKARALSQEDPSLIWLAISIVGTVFDIKGATSAIKTFRTLTPLAKVAEGAESVREAEIAIEALGIAARREGGEQLGEQLAKSVITNVRRTRGGESLALEAAGASMAERKALEAATRATKKEAADLIGAAKRSASSNVNISKKGNIFSCTNPCALFREKYAAALAKDPVLEKELAGLEKRALEAAAETKRSGPRAGKLVERVKNDAADFETEIRKAHPDIVPKSAIEDPAALQQIKLVEAEAASIGKRIKPGELKPPPPKIPKSIKVERQLWKDYEDYYATRYSAIKAEEKAGTVTSKYPLEWGEYQSFRVLYQRVSSTLSALERQFPILRDLPLEVSALLRVIAKGSDVNQMKGQLLEEFMAVSIRKLFKSPAARKALGLGRVHGELEFIEGHLIKLGGRWFTDGVIGVRNGDKFEILVIFEAKSGQKSARGLALSVQTVKSMKHDDKLELFNFIRGEMPEQLFQFLKTHYPSIASSFKLTVGKKPRLVVQTNLGPHASKEVIIAKVNKILKKIDTEDLNIITTNPMFRQSAEGLIKTTEIGGQIRRDIERVYGLTETSKARSQKGTLITIDGKEIEAFLNPSGVQFRGVVPSDVNTDYIEKTLTGLGYHFESESMPITREDLIKLTKALKAQLKTQNP
jgi:hypothetical protein